MPRIDDSTEKTKHTIWLFDGDMQKLVDIFGQRKASRVIRATVRSLITKIEAQQSQLDPADTPDLEDI